MFKHLLSKSAFFQDIFFQDILNPSSKWNSGLKRFSVLTIALFIGYFLLWNSRLMHLFGRLGVSLSLDFKLRGLESSLLLGQMVKLLSSSRSHEVENCRAVQSSCWVWGSCNDLWNEDSNVFTLFQYLSAKDAACYPEVMGGFQGPSSNLNASSGLE